MVGRGEVKGGGVEGIRPRRDGHHDSRHGTTPQDLCSALPCRAGLSTESPALSEVGGREWGWAHRHERASSYDDTGWRKTDEESTL